MPKPVRLPIKRTCPTLATLTDDYLAEKAVHCMEQTITNCRISQEQFARFLAEVGLPDDMSAFTRKDALLYVTWCRGHLKDSSVKLRADHLHTFLRWCVRERVIDSDPMEGLQSPHVGEPLTNYLAKDAFDAMVRTCSSKSFEDIRDKAILLLAVDTGVRLGGMIHLTLQDIDWKANILSIMVAKGDRAYKVKFGNDTAIALRAYRRERETHPASLFGEALWLGKFGPWKRTGFQKMVKRRAALAGLQQNVYMHLFRHTFAHNMRMSGASDKTVMRLGNWRDWKSYERYATLGEQAEALANYVSPVDSGLTEH